MSIAADSRYVFGDYETVQVTATTFDVAVFAGAVVVDNVQISYYITVQGDAFDKLALRFFGDATKWWIIADLNPEVRWPGVIDDGLTLRIPLFTDSVGVNSVSSDSSLGLFDSSSSTRG